MGNDKFSETLLVLPDQQSKTQMHSTNNDVKKTKAERNHSQSNQGPQTFYILVFKSNAIYYSMTQPVQTLQRLSLQKFQGSSLKVRSVRS